MQYLQFALEIFVCKNNVCEFEGIINWCVTRHIKCQLYFIILFQQDNEQWRVVSGENLQYVWRCYIFPVAAVTIKYFWNNKWAWVNIILNCILLSLLNLKRVHLLDVTAAWQRNTIFVFNTNITISIILIFISLTQYRDCISYNPPY